MKTIKAVELQSYILIENVSLKCILKHCWPWNSILVKEMRLLPLSQWCHHLIDTELHLLAADRVELMKFKSH